MASLERTALIHALQWHLDAGADEGLSADPVNSTAVPALSTLIAPAPLPPAPQAEGSPAAAAESRKLAAAATTLDDLRAAIAAFDGLTIRKTAMNMVFADGNPAASVMLIGEAPGADEDKAGKPFAGASGALLDKILASIGMDRDTIYISTLLNWRPPGNRTPTDAEIDISRAFIERHIELARPQILLLSGVTVARALLRTTDSLSKLRGRWHDLNGMSVLVTHNLATLSANPLNKRAVWQDMLALQEKRTPPTH